MTVDGASVMAMRAESTARRVLVLILSGDPAAADRLVHERWPGATVTALTKDGLKYAGALDRIRMLRAAGADTCVVFGRDLESLSGLGVPTLRLVAWLAGSSALWLLDGSGKGTRYGVRLAPVTAGTRLAAEVVVGSMFLASSSLLARAAVRLRSTALRLPTRSLTPTPRRVLVLRSLGYRSGWGVGGTASHSIGITEALSQLGLDVTVFTRPPVPGFDRGRVRLRELPFGGTLFTLRPFVELENHLRFAWAAWRAARRAPPDMLYQRHTRFDPSGVILAAALRRPLVLEHEGSEHRNLALSWSPSSELGPAWSFRRTLDSFERLNHTFAARIIALSDEIRRDLVEDRAVGPEKIVVVPSGVDVARFGPERGGAETRARLGITSYEVAVGFTGSFAPWHGTRTLAHAMALLPESPRFHFLFVGDGDGRAETQALVESSRGSHRASFTGLVDFAAVPALVDACDVLVCPTEPMPDGSEFFGSPTKLFEYMAAGKPIVASRLGQIAEVLDDGRTALLASPGDPAALADRLVLLGRDGELRRRLGAAARDDAERRFSWRRNAEAVVESYGAWMRDADETGGRRGG